MRTGAVAVCGGPGDFRFEQGDACGQFIDRKMVKRFPCQLTGKIPDRARAII